MESLFQGTGALAILVTGLAFALQVARGASRRSDNARLLFIWMTFHGLFQSLPQVVVGAIDPGNDVGMAMDYFQLTQAAKTAAALAALAAIPLVGIWLTRHLLGLAGDADRIGEPRQPACASSSSPRPFRLSRRCRSSFCFACRAS